MVLKKSVRERKRKTALPKVKTSAKSVQTTRVVCTNFSRSLSRLQLKFAEGYAQMNFSASLFTSSVTQECIIVIDHKRRIFVGIKKQIKAE